MKKIYTRSGDKGRTSLFSGERVSKAAIRVDAYGDVDELNSVLGALAASLSGDNPQVGRAVEQVQRELFCVGGRLATTRINVDEHPVLAARYNVHAVPTLALVKDGQLVDQFVGFASRERLQEAIDWALTQSR